MKKEDNLLETLGRVGRQQEASSDPRWAALAAGTLSEAEAEALRREAELTEDGRRRYELFRPFDEGTRERVFERLSAEAAAAGGNNAPKSPEPAPPARVTPLRAKVRARASFAIAAAMAIAAAFAFLFLPKSFAPLPTYELAARGESAQQGDSDPPSSPLRLTDWDSSFEVILSPEKEAGGDVVARTLLAQGRNVRAWAPPPKLITSTQGGVISFKGTKRELFPEIPPGTWTLVIAVGRPGAMPKDEELLTEAERSDGHAAKPGYQVFSRKLVLIDGPGGQLPPPFEIEPSGCGAVRSLPGGGVVCEIPANRELRFYVKAPEGASVTPLADGKPAGVITTIPVQGGVRLHVTIPAGARALSIGPSFRLALVERENSPARAALDEAEWLRKQGKLDEARARTALALRDPAPEIRALATGELARIELAGSAHEKAIERFKEAIGLDKAAQLISAEVKDRFALSFTLFNHGRRFEEATEVAEGVAPLESEHYVEGRILSSYYLGIIRYEAGDLRAALRMLGEAERGAERLGLDDERSAAQSLLADLLVTLGRPEEALAIFREQEQQGAPFAGADACIQASFFNDFGWFAYRMRESAEGAALEGVPDPTLMLEEALELLYGTCKDRSLLGITLTNLALVASSLGHANEAEGYLDEARAADSRANAPLANWWRLVEARIALQRELHEEALTAYAELAELARGASSAELGVEAALGRAQVLEKLGRDDEARRSYAEADALLDDRSLLIPLGQGKETFLARHEQSTRLRIDFLLRRAARADGPASAELLREAATAARRSRARILSTLRWVDRVDALPQGEREKWMNALDAHREARAALASAAQSRQLPRARREKAEEERKAKLRKLGETLDQLIAISDPRRAEAQEASLAEPEEGEVILVYHPIREGWAGFAITPREVTAHLLGELDPATLEAGASREKKERLAGQILSPFREALSVAERVRLAAYGPLDRVDIHALPWEGGYLLDAVPVIHGVDLSLIRRDPAPLPISPRAVIVADPIGDLPGSRREAAAVAAALQRRGFQVERLEGDAATHRAVRDALERPDTRLFHYTGHGRFGGRDGWESGLHLAGDAWLTAADVLALSRVPPEVVLSGCETAKTAATARPQGLGLAQAFIATGAESVVATGRAVDDGLGAHIMRRLHDAPPAGTPADLALAFRGALLAFAASSPESDWAAFRLLAP